MGTGPEGTYEVYHISAVVLLQHPHLPPHTHTPYLLTSANHNPPLQSAIVDISPSICGTLMRAHPHSASAIHHHGSQDTVVYAVSGHGSLVSSSGTTKSGPFGDVRQDLKPGDWALIPAYREHQEVNDGEDEVVWVIVRAPEGVPVVENLEAWGASLK